MRKINKILVPTDFSDTALNAYRYALLLAEAVGAGIELLHTVYPEVTTGEMPTYHVTYIDKMVEVAEENLNEFAQRGISPLVQRLTSTHLVNHIVEVGGTIPAIKNRAQKDACDLVIMGTKGARSTWNNLFGTHSTGVLMNAPCPVLIVPEDGQFTGYKKFCFATDLENMDVFSGKELIDAFAPINPGIHFLHVSGRNEPDHSMKLSLIEKFYELRGSDMDVTTADVQSERIAEAIIAEANTQGCDLIVMSRPHYSFLDQLFHKSITREVALITHLPVLVLGAKDLAN